jgi:hypothetical protein
MKLVKKILEITLAALLVLITLHFLAMNPQPIALVTLLGSLPLLSVGQISLGSWLVGMVMGLLSMKIFHRWRARKTS